MLFLPGQPPEAPKLTPEAPLALNKALVPICTCESAQGTTEPQQYDLKTGGVLHGKVNPLDIGACQINEKWNGEEATKHGWDIYTLEGNIKMANWMYKTQGTKPWLSSVSCWHDV